MFPFRRQAIVANFEKSDAIPRHFPLCKTGIDMGDYVGKRNDIHPIHHGGNLGGIQRPISEIISVGRRFAAIGVVRLSEPLQTLVSVA
jgi:hypothetical protein